MLRSLLIPMHVYNLLANPHYDHHMYSYHYSMFIQDPHMFTNVILPVNCLYTNDPRLDMLHNISLIINSLTLNSNLLHHAHISIPMYCLNNLVVVIQNYLYMSQSLQHFHLPLFLLLLLDLLYIMQLLDLLHYNQIILIYLLYDLLLPDYDQHTHNVLLMSFLVLTLH